MCVFCIVVFTLPMLFLTSQKESKLNKIKTSYFCTSCGAQTAKWVGKCPSCNEWNTITEEKIVKKSPSSSKYEMLTQSKAMKISEIQVEGEERLILSDSELNRVLGGGLVQGSVVLVGGEPGIGKSTLILQNVLFSSYKTLYVAGEESNNQVSMRAKRIGIRNDDCYIIQETMVEQIIKVAKELKPEILVIDSIQTLEHEMLESAPGSVSQVKESAASLIRFAKTSGVPVFIIGHINKDGAIAGPKILEHMVDVVLQFEGERNYQFRILRTIKNRYGSANELGIYEMASDGLKAVENPSEVLISDNNEGLSGVAVCAAIEGNRPLLIEVQALVSPAVYGTPQRNANGFDLRRLAMLLAVLEKRSGFQLTGKDVFVNITGGFKPEDPGLDLAVAAAIISSYENIAIKKNSAFAGEIGLSGEIRPAFRIEQRISEASRLGIETLFCSEFSKISADNKKQLHVETVRKTDDLPELLF
jgi:DNA repair protein RadA/Sms